jgi:hypothetical protein
MPKFMTPPKNKDSRHTPEELPNAPKKAKNNQVVHDTTSDGVAKKLDF